MTWMLWAALGLLSYMLRIVYLRRHHLFGLKRSPEKPVRTAIVLGSGGHTAEMLRLVDCLDTLKYQPIKFYVADTDHMTKRKLSIREVKEKDIEVIPRSREVGQSYVSSVVTTLAACAKAVPYTFLFRPDLVLVNGPGTCLPVCLAALIMNVLAIKKVSVVFVESLCRVETLSLTGKILYHFADIFVVQWPSLKAKYPKSSYLGRVV